MQEDKLKFQFDLQLFAKDGPSGEKTEEATPKKKQDTRKEGSVVNSKDLTVGFSLLSVFLTLRFAVGYVGRKILASFYEFYNMIPRFVRDGIDIKACSELTARILLDVILMILPFLLTGFIVGFLATKVQFKWMVTTKPLKPKLSKINPIKGFKRMFSKQTLFELAKAIIKIVLIGYVVYDSLNDRKHLLYSLYDMGMQQSLTVLLHVLFQVGMKTSVVMILIGIVDYAYRKHKHNEDIKMSKQEVKDEFKNTEGDPKIKSQQKQRMMQASQRRMMQAIPQADVVITNPTHFAVALSYDANISTAPIVVAKGADFVAGKIKEIARDNHVEIVENKPLARMLYYNVDLNKEIPPELYQAVAEVLAYVYNLKNAS